MTINKGILMMIKQFIYVCFCYSHFQLKEQGILNTNIQVDKEAMCHVMDIIQYVFSIHTHT